jgi:hypothetical protein
MEKDVIAAGTLDPLVELDGEVEARRQVGELTGKGHFPAVQVEGNAHATWCTDSGIPKAME